MEERYVTYFSPKYFTWANNYWQKIMEEMDIWLFFLAPITPAIFTVVL
jgi:hypothetical protein